MMRAVGRVGVDEEVRVPRVEKLNQGAGLGRFELDEVSVQVEAAGIGRWPMPSSGPTWPGRFVFETRSLPSAL